MISKILTALENGLTVMRSNSRMALVALLVFVFPLLFAWLTHSFFTTATVNIDTAQKQRVAVIHDSLSALITHTQLSSDETINSLLREYKEGNPDLTQVRVVVKDADKFRVIYDLNPELVGTYEKSDQLYRDLPQSASQDSFIYKLSINGSRVWQVLNRVNLNDSEIIIFSEHNFDFIDQVMYSRKQQSYFGLTAIFLFLIALAYWLNRQDDWFVKYSAIAKQLNERDKFTNMIAHEFRTPLTVIKGYASFLEESKTINPEEMRFVNNIHTATERLVLLVNDFLEVARLNSGRLEITKTKVDLIPVINQVCEDLQSLAAKQNLQLVGISNEKPINLNTDAKRVTQILINIITNSIKYTQSGKVSLECIDGPDDVTILVKDTGMGISADDQKKLFTPFTRVGGVDETTVTGTGLGMWITKQLIELLNGTIGVESIKGVGTHMVIKFSKGV